MEDELNRLIEFQNKEYEKNFHEHDDDMISNIDIDDFEMRLKQDKSMMGRNNDDSSDDDLPRPATTQKKPVTSTTSKPWQPPVKQQQQHHQPQSKFLLSEEPDLLRHIQEIDQNKNKGVQKTSSTSNKMNDLQNEITKYKQEAKPKTEDDKLQELLLSNNAGLKDKKLKELIVKNKELYVNYEKEKTMRQKLQKDMDKIKEDTDMQLAAMEGKYPKGPPKQQDEGAEWRKKYNDLEKKLQEVKLQNTTLKNDVNKAMRVISREVGDHVSIDQILTQENTWKGRAQQIEVLKARVKELQSKAGGSKDFSDVSFNDRSQSDLTSVLNNGRGAFNNGGKMKERREEVEQLKTQIEALKAENDTLNDKVKGVSSRKTILEKDMKEVRNDFERSKTLLIEKSENDDRYIAALRKEVEKLKNQGGSGQVQTRIVYRDKPVESKKSEVEELEDNLAKKEILILKNELDRKEKIIKELINEKVRLGTNNLNLAPNVGKENMSGDSSSDQERIIKLETVVKILKQENEELSNLKLGIKNPTPDAKIIKDLSLQNAQLRRKLDDLQQKMKPAQ